MRRSSTLNRRTLFHRGALCIAGLGAKDLLAADLEAKPLLRAGLLTDLHYADKPEAINRFYRQTPHKLDEAVQKFNAESPAFVVELGDLIDQADTADREIEWLRTIEKHFAALKAPRHYVLGNHCVATLTKQEFAANTGASKEPHYSFDHSGIRFLVLDACYREDGTPYGRGNSDWRDANIPDIQLSWIKSQLASASGPVVVFAHQRLDMHANHSVRNAAAVRAELEKPRNVLCVFQGHSHVNDLQTLNGIPYVTLVGLIEGSGEENNGYAMLEVLPDSSLRLQGFRKQAQRKIAKPV